MGEDTDKQAMDRVIELHKQLEGLEKMVEGGSHYKTVLQQCLEMEKSLALLKRAVLEQRLEELN